MTQRGATGVLYRATQRDSNGDPVDENGNVVRPGANGQEIGTIKGILIGGMSASPSMQQQETSDTTGQIGIPNRKNPYEVRFGDRLLIEGTMFRVVSRPLWTYPNSNTGTKPEYTWFSVEGTTGGR